MLAALVLAKSCGVAVGAGGAVAMWRAGGGTALRTARGLRYADGGRVTVDLYHET